MKSQSFIKHFLLTVIISTVSLCSMAHPWKPSNYVIIDTDGGVDDMRAISMMLASPDVRVMAIIVSPGILSSKMAYIQVKSMLNAYFHEGIPVGINRNIDFVPPYKTSAMKYQWGNISGIDSESAPSMEEVVESVLSVEKSKARLVCLGSLTTARNMLEKIPLVKQQVKEIIWTSEGLETVKSLNYSIDKQAVSYISRQKDIPISIVKSFSKQKKIHFYNSPLIEAIKNIDNIYGKKISDYFSSPLSADNYYRFIAFDEMAPLFIHYPSLFERHEYESVMEYTPVCIDSLRAKAVTIISGKTVEENQVVKNFPDDPLFYFDDMQPFVKEIISKYGKEEWTSGVIASELHRHLGVFAIVGVKMGIRVREYFRTGVDEISVVSYAGSTPPLSCMNDGLQVSTGATPGHGLLHISNDTNTSATVDFTYLNRTIRISLKPETTKKILSELKEIDYIYGLDSNIYWELVRKNTLKYWLQFDRHEIFTIEEL